MARKTSSIQATATCFADIVRSRDAALASFSDHLTALRAQISDIKSRLTDLEDVAPSDDDIAIRSRSVVDLLAEQLRGALPGHLLRRSADGWSAADVAAFLAAPGRITEADDEWGGRSTIVAPIKTSPAHFAAVFFPSEFAALLTTTTTSEIRASELLQLTTDEIASERLSLSTELDRLSQEEELFIRQATAAGLNIARRPDALPQWLLTPDKVLEALVGDEGA